MIIGWDALEAANGPPAQAQHGRFVWIAGLRQIRQMDGQIDRQIHIYIYTHTLHCVAYLFLYYYMYVCMCYYYYLFPFSHFFCPRQVYSTGYVQDYLARLLQSSCIQLQLMQSGCKPDLRAQTKLYYIHTVLRAQTTLFIYYYYI